MDGRTFRLVESIGPEGRCFENCAGQYSLLFYRTVTGFGQVVNTDPCSKVLYGPVQFCIALPFAMLYCTALCCVVLHCPVQCCIALPCAVVYCTALCCFVLHCPVQCYNALPCAVLYCTALYSVVLHCPVQCCNAMSSAVFYCTALFRVALHKTIIVKWKILMMLKGEVSRTGRYKNCVSSTAPFCDGIVQFLNELFCPVLL